MTRVLEEQVVLITGCSTGIGRALALAFHRRGHRVFATARRPEAIADLAAQGMAALALDVTDPASIAVAVRETLDRAGRIDILVNNAGLGVMGPAAELSLAEFRRGLETNVTAPLALVQQVVPHMAARRTGRIVNVESVMAVLTTPFAGAYCASKAALASLSEALRMELAPFGIDVVSVQPGGVRSRFADSSEGLWERTRPAGSLYADRQGAIRRRIRASANRPMDADAFAEKVVAAVTRRKAPRLVRHGTGSFLLPALARWVPPRALAFLLRRLFGL